MVQYDPSLPEKIYTDASQAGLGAVIFYMMPDGTERPIKFASRRFLGLNRVRPFFKIFGLNPNAVDLSEK